MQCGICRTISSSAKCFNHYKCTSKLMTFADSYTMDLDNAIHPSSGFNKQSMFTADVLPINPALCNCN